VSWRGFKKGLRDIINPRYLRDLTPEQREERRERQWREGHGYINFWPRMIRPTKAEDRNEPRDK
jgi:hypothetical protein